MQSSEPNVLKTRTVGNVHQNKNGKFYWICEFYVGVHPELLRIDSSSGDCPLLYDTREQAGNGLKDCAKRIQKALIEKVGVKNVVFAEQRGKLYSGD